MQIINTDILTYYFLTAKMEVFSLYHLRVQMMHFLYITELREVLNIF